MLTYIVMMKFTDRGIRNVRQTVERAAFFRETMGEKLGIAVKDLYWTSGDYDLISVVEVPDEETAAAMNLSLESLGNVRSQTVRAYSEPEMRGIIDKMI